jgi:signal transduction histidine kinase
MSQGEELLGSRVAIPAPKGGRPLRRAFALIIVGFILSSAVSIYEMQNTQARVQAVTEQMLAGVELVTQISRALDQKRSLIEAHILEEQDGEKKRIEQELSDINARISAASRAYQGQLSDDVERADWQRLESAVARIEPEIANVVELSGRNLDVEARRRMQAIESRFNAIDRVTDTLVRISEQRAGRAISGIRALQRQAIVILAGLTVVWTGLSLLTARWVTRLIEDREQQMRKATTLLEVRNRELDAFAGRVAHDLRGPLTTISLAASLLAQNRVAEAGPIAAFRRAVTQMEALIHDLLALSRLSDLQKTGATCQTETVAASVGDDLGPRVYAIGGLLYVFATPATVSCSEGLLRQVLWNLGENALKYRRPEVQLNVAIRGRLTPDAYEFTVTDNGTGMSSLETQRAFEPFFRGGQATSTAGTGLGLSIVKRVIEASGGSVSVDSVPGQGSTFKVRLPLATSKAA